MLLAFALGAASVPVLAAEHTTPAPSEAVRAPQFREAVFYFLQEDYVRALALLPVDAPTDRSGADAGETDLLRGIAFLSYGLPAEAEAMFRRLLQDGASAAATDQAWFYLAKLHHRRGETGRADQALQQIKGVLPETLDDERRVLHAYVLLDRDQPPAAIRMLDGLRGDSVWGAYGRYNLGVALVRLGDRRRGLALLDTLGARTVRDEELAALKDQANVAAAYAHLQANDAVAARRLLTRVRLESPSANKALLGMGWAYAGERQYERALVYWEELARRDIADPATQEARLAVPYALQRLGAVQPSREQYETAIAAFDAEIGHLEAAMRDVRAGTFVQRLTANADAELIQYPEHRYLRALYASHAFHAALAQYRELLGLKAYFHDGARRLDRLDRALLRKPDGEREKRVARLTQERARVTRLNTETDAAIRHQTQLLVRLVLEDLERNQRRLIANRAQARFAIAEFKNRESPSERTE